MYIENIKILVISGLILAMWGCGMLAKPKEDNQKAITVPQKISMEMPKELQSKQKPKKRKYLKKESNNTSIGYISLKEDIAQVEYNIDDVELSLLFINQVIGDIEGRCSDTQLEHICKIGEDELSFVIDKNLSKEINSSDYLVGDTISFGEVEFIRYPKREKYQYSIKFDNMFVDVLSTETIKWSEDKKQISSLYIENSQEDNLSLKIDYYTKSNGDQEIHINDNYLDKETNSSDIFSLNMLKKADRDRYYEITSNSKMVEYIDNSREDSYYSTEGILSSNGGYLLFYGEFYNERFGERETFDGEGKHISTYYCDDYVDCDIDDENSWEEL